MISVRGRCRMSVGPWMPKAGPAKILFRRCFASTSAECGKKELKPVIGLEVHAQLYCASKLFSDAPSGNSPNFGPQNAGFSPAEMSSTNVPCNSQVALFDMATPGTLPRLNYESVQQCLRASILLNCHIPKWCRFDRKHYFYPDLPPGYQITQKDFPIAERGYLDFFVYPSIVPFAMLAPPKRKKEGGSDSSNPTAKYTARCGIERLQLETDSGKLLKFEDNASKIELIDLNRAGVPLIEIVTAPELHSAQEAACFVEQLRELLRFNGVCEGEMHKGNLRVDANVSVSIDGEPGARTEIKNINSLRFLQGAIDNEIRRQCAMIWKGETVHEETRNLDTETLKTVAVREKGEGLDYRFTPEPNLPRLQIKPEWVENAKSFVVHQLPYEKYIDAFNFPPSFAIHVAQEADLKRFMDLCLSDLSGIEFLKFYEWILEFKRIYEDGGNRFPPTDENVIRNFRDTIRFEHEGKLTRAICFDLLKDYCGSPMAAGSHTSLFEEIEKKNLWRIHDPAKITAQIEEVMRVQPQLREKALANGGPKLGHKHFNRLRNEVVLISEKRVDVGDVEQTLFKLLSEDNNKTN